MSEDVEVVTKWKEEVKDERVIRKHLDVYPPPFGIDFWILPHDFWVDWERWMKRNGAKAVLDMGLCEHGGLTWDPMMELPHYVTERGWEEVIKRWAQVGSADDRYGEQPPVVIQFGAHAMSGKRVPVVSVNPGVCDECRVKRWVWVRMR